MDVRLLALALPSAVVLALLVAHSARALPRRRAVAFWASVLAYGVVRRLGVGWITVEGLGGLQPYEIHRPLFPILGVPLQELVGWAIVVYLAWWLGERFARRLASGPPPVFAGLLWGCLFLGAVSWAVEAAAVGAGWWHWTLPVSAPLFLNVPFIGLVDWFFVGVDFLLPFVVLSSSAFADRWWRWASLLAFPLHFGSHLLIEPPSALVPVPVFHLVHWALLAALVWAALRSPAGETAFAEPAGTIGRLPVVAAVVVLADLVVVDLFVAARPELLVAVVPAALVVAVTLAPNLGHGAGAAAVVGGLVHPSLALGVLPSLAAAGVRIGRRAGRRGAVMALALLALTAGLGHRRENAARQELEAGLELALAARDAGDLGTAEAQLAELAGDHPGSHVPAALLGEILYRRDRLEEAAAAYRRVVRIKADHLPAHRHLAVIALRQGKRQEAAAAAEAGLFIATADLQLRYLARRAAGGGAEPMWDEVERLGPEGAAGLAALAFEVGDTAGATGLLDRALERWPDDPELRRRRERLAAAAR